jgi:hypothetical protein
MSLQSQPEACYETLNIAIISIQSFALSHGHGIKKGRPRTIGNRTGAEIKNVDLLCVYGGKHKPKDNSIQNGSHNHNATDNIAAYPSARTLTEEQYQIAKQMSKAGVEPKAILAHYVSLIQNVELLVVIYTTLSSRLSMTSDVLLKLYWTSFEFMLYWKFNTSVYYPRTFRKKKVIQMIPTTCQFPHQQPPHLNFIHAGEKIWPQFWGR